MSIDVITRVRDEARATLRQIADRLADPCAACASADLCGYIPCPIAPLFPCPDMACEFCGDCEQGTLCAMIRPELKPLDLECGEARDLAEYMATHGA